MVIVPTQDYEGTPSPQLNITGPQGKTIFWALISWLIADIDAVSQMQLQIDETLAHVHNLNDDRLLVLLGTLVVENAVDELATTVMPGYKSLRDKRDFTFSMRIEVVRALRIIPTWLLNYADCIRSTRNDFVHDLSIDAFAKLKSSKQQSMCDYLKRFNPDEAEGKTEAEVFEKLVSFTAVALYAYRVQTSQLDAFLRSQEFIKHYMKSWKTKAG